jgi:hypothetical protein
VSHGDPEHQVAAWYDLRALLAAGAKEELSP